MHNKVTLPTRVWRNVVSHMVSQESQECCGLLAGRFIDHEEYTVAEVDSFQAIDNINPDPAALFVMDPHQQLDFFKRTLDAGKHIVGCVHSHPHGFGVPSDIDRMGINEDYAWLIWGHLDNKLRAWWPASIEEKRFRGAYLLCQNQ